MSKNRRCRRGPLALATALATVLTTALTLLSGCGDGADQPVATAAATALVTGENFSVRMPGPPERNEQANPESGFTLEIYLYDTTASAFTFSRALYPTDEIPDLDKTLQGSAESAGGTIAAQSTSGYRGADTREATIVNAVLDGRPVVIFARYVLVNNVVYGLTYLAKDHLPDGPPPAFLAFANSLQFT